MLPFEAARPLHGTVKLSKVAMRFFRHSAVPIIDDWGNCIGVLHREDCREVIIEMVETKCFSFPFLDFLKYLPSNIATLIRTNACLYELIQVCILSCS